MAHPSRLWDVSDHEAECIWTCRIADRTELGFSHSLACITRLPLRLLPHPRCAQWQARGHQPGLHCLNTTRLLASAACICCNTYWQLLNGLKLCQYLITCAAVCTSLLLAEELTKEPSMHCHSQGSRAGLASGTFTASSVCQLPVCAVQKAGSAHDT